MSVTTRTLKVEVDKKWVSDFNANGMKLCCAFVVKRGMQEYCNVVAGAFGVQQSSSITWVEKYAIAATSSSFKAKDKVSGGTTPEEIRRGQSITVAADGTPTTVTTDDQVAKDAFRFIHMESPASAVVYMTVDNTQVPIYITNNSPQPRSQQDLSPKAKIKVWFDDQTEAGNYFNNITNVVVNEINMEGKEVTTVQYTSDGTWTTKQAAAMITIYRLTVEIDPHWVAHFRRTKFSICTSFGFKSNYIDMDYSVIATAADPTPLNTITWKEEFTYAACKESPQLNCPVFESTKPVPVGNNERLVIQNDWTVGSIGWDERAPKDGILFVNDTSATSLVFKTVNNYAVPVYVSSTGGTTPPRGQHTLVPTGKIMVFFMAQEERTVFSKDRVNTRVIEVPYTDKPTMTVFYNKDGLWEMKDAQRNTNTKL